MPVLGGVDVVIAVGGRACADVDLDVTAVGGRAGGGAGVAVSSGVDGAATDVGARAGGGVDVNVSAVGGRAGSSAGDGVNFEVSAVIGRTGGSAGDGVNVEVSAVIRRAGDSADDASTLRSALSEGRADGGVTAVGGRATLSLAGAATSIVFVMTNFLSGQKYACCNKTVAASNRHFYRRSFRHSHIDS